MTSILIISELFYPEGGGAGKATYLVLRYLVEYNFKITVLASTRDPIKIPGVKYYITLLLQHADRVTKLIRLKLFANNSISTKLLCDHDVLYIPLYAYPLIPIAKQKGYA